MQIIQQKLIWFLGCGSLLIIIYRMDFLRLISAQALYKLKAGLILVTAGAALGIISELGLTGRWLTSSGLTFYLESLLGYFVGGSLIVWGAIEWTAEYSGIKGKQLAKSRLRLFLEKASAIVLKEHGSQSLLEKISKSLLMALDCQALILHKRLDNGSLRLVFQSGLTPETEETLRNPQTESLFSAAVRDKQIMSSDNAMDLHTIVRLEAKSGIIESGLSIPLVLGGEILGVFTLLYGKQRSHIEGELDLLEMISSALTATMRAEKLEQDQAQETQSRELYRLIAVAFDRQSSMLTALVESARIAYPHLHFDEINLYLSDDGQSRSHDFALPEGGKVNFVEGFLTRSEYSHLYKDIGDVGVYMIPERQAVISQFDIGNNGHAWLEVRLKRIPIYLADLVRAWSHLLAKKITLERLEKAMEQTNNWLGAIRFYQERALAAEDVAGLLEEMAALVINLGMATFCRISLTDPQKLRLRTIALAQIRPLNWSSVRGEVPTVEVDTLRRALVTNKYVEFDQEKPGHKLSEQEARLVLPPGVRHGIILPLTIKNDPVGLMILGEFRGRQRALEPGLATIFASDLAALISMVLSWHKEKRISQAVSEGKKKLSIIRKELRKAPADLSPSLKSRLNGPLAGIMASCEYLHNDKFDLEREVGRYLDIIEKNAARIYEITAGTVKIQ